jgi:hypothetical protein
MGFPVPGTGERFPKNQWPITRVYGKGIMIYLELVGVINQLITYFNGHSRNPNWRYLSYARPM